MDKSFWLPLMVAIGTMIVLYIIGFIGDIEFLVFKFSLSNTEIALLPIVVGVVVAIISDRIIKFRSLE